MKTIMVVMMTCATLGASLSASASDDALRKAIYDCVVKDMGGAGEYAKFARKQDARYDQWQKDNDGMDLKVFLDNKLLEIAPSVKGGDVEPVKRFLQWLSLYYAKNEPFPSYADKINDEDRKAMKEILVPETFSWQNVSEFVKRKAKEFEKKK